jgi:hypothetical protein
MRVVVILFDSSVQNRAHKPDGASRMLVSRTSKIYLVGSNGDYSRGTALRLYIALDAQRL